jgi:hypothetical protein
VDFSKLSAPSLLAHIEAMERKGVHRQEIYELGDVSPELISGIHAGSTRLQDVDPREFEELVAELLRADGYESVELVPRLNAHGPDIIARCTGPSGQPNSFVVEVKRWLGPVGVEVVRSLVYKLEYETPMTGAMIVTSSRFTSEARRHAERYHPWRLHLKDAAAVRDWIQRRAQRRRTAEVEHLILGSTEAGDTILRILRGAPAPDAPDLKRAADVACENCGGDLICGYVDLGGTDWYHNYFHICSCCLNHQHREDYESGPEPTTVAGPRCPFCRGAWY